VKGLWRSGGWEVPSASSLQLGCKEKTRTPAKVESSFGDAWEGKPKKKRKRVEKGKRSPSAEGYPIPKPQWGERV